MEPSTFHISQFILKVASRCNLNCPYCYVYNKADSTWKQRPPLMSDDIFSAALERLRNHCLFSGQKYANIIFHGGEPCLIGARKFDEWCMRAQALLAGIAKPSFSIQTNGTLIDEAWAEAFEKHRVLVGISMDGPQSIHDVFRVDHSGKGSYQQVERGVQVLRNAGIPYGILSVIALGADPLAVHRHFMGLGCKQVTYLLPHFTHDTIEPIHKLYGPTPCADFLIPIFEDWWFNGTPDIDIGDLRNLARIVMGGRSIIETVGNVAPLYVFIESDGELEGLDNLRACKDGICKTNLNVQDAEFRDILRSNTMHGIAIFEGMPLSKTCRSCPECDNCGGGYLPHRYSSVNGFDNPSVWCADLLKIFAHVRLRLGVTIDETRQRRLALAGALAEAANAQLAQ
jgi:uncharacterized protein